MAKGDGQRYGMVLSVLDLVTCLQHPTVIVVVVIVVYITLPLFTVSHCCYYLQSFPSYSCVHCPVHVFRVYIPSCVVVVVYITLSLLSTHLVDLHSTLFYIPSCCCCCLHNTPLVYSIQQAEMIAAKNALSSSKLPLTILQRHCKSTRFVEGEVKSE